MNIGWFQSAIEKYGVARTNRYSVYIPVAALVAKVEAAAVDNPDGTYFQALCSDMDANEMTKRLFFFCKKAELPGLSYNYEDMRFYGESFKLPYQPVYTDMTLTFLCGGDMLERAFFDAWMYSVMDPATRDFNYLTEYTVDIVVNQYDEVGDSNSEDQITYKAKVFDAWPITVNQMDVSYDADNQVHEVAVAFAYRRWLPAQLGFNGTANTAPRGPQENFNQTVSFNPKSSNGGGG